MVTVSEAETRLSLSVSVSVTVGAVISTTLSLKTLLSVVGGDSVVVSSTIRVNEVVPPEICVTPLELISKELPSIVKYWLSFSVGLIE